MMLAGTRKHLIKYLLNDGAFMGDFQHQITSESQMTVNIKMLNFTGHIILKVRLCLN